MNWLPWAGFLVILLSGGVLIWFAVKGVPKDHGPGA